MAENANGTVGEPAPSGLNTNAGTPSDTSASNKGDKARIGTDAFLLSLGLDPAAGWKVVGTPVQKTSSVGGAVVPVAGQYTIQAVGPKGETRTITMQPQGGDAAIQGKPLDQVDWTPTAVDQTVSPATKTQGETDAAIAASQAQVEQAKAAAAKSAADLAQVQNDNAQRQKNLASTGYYLTDKERADQEAQLRSSGLQQAQIDAQLKIASDNNRNSAAANEIAAQNANTNAQVAAHNAVIDDARVKLGNDQLTLDQSKQVFTEEQAKITQAQTDRKIALDELTQRQANLVAQSQIETSQQSNVLRGQEAVETGRHNAATEAQQAAATQATAQAAAANTAQQAAGNILTGVNNAAQTGAGLLQNRVTAATGALNNVVGQLGGGNLGGSVGLPSGWGSNLVNGLQEWVTGLGGGPAVYDSAAAMVNQANPAISGNPTLAQQAYASLRGMMDLYKAQTGQEHPLEAQQRQQAQVVTSPNTAVGAGGRGEALPQTNVSVQQNLATQQQANAQAAGAAAQPSTAQLNASGYADTPDGRAQFAAGQPPSGMGSLGGIRAPTTAPGMINTGYQVGSAVGQPANVALSSMTLGNQGAPWGVPQIRPIPVPALPVVAPVTA